jgi:WD40 repeat protein
MAAAAVEDKIIAAQGGWQVLHVWDVGLQQLLGTIRGPGAVDCLLAHQIDDRWIVISSYESSSLRVWDLLTQVPIGAPLTGHTAQITNLAISDGGDLLISTSDDGTARIWNLRTHEAVGVPFGDHQLGAKAVSVGELDGREIIVTGDGSGHIRAWDLVTGNTLRLGIQPHSDAIARLRMRRLNGVTVLVTGVPRSFGELGHDS